MTFLWGVTDYLARQLQIVVMHTAHLANVSKSVTKNATFSRTGGLPTVEKLGPTALVAKFGTRQ